MGLEDYVLKILIYDKKFSYLFQESNRLEKNKLVTIHAEKWTTLHLNAMPIFQGHVSLSYLKYRANTNDVCAIEHRE